MNLVIDVGNTNTKIGIFEDNELIEKIIYKNGEEIPEDSFLTKTYQKAIISGSGNTKIPLWNSIQANEKVHFDTIDRNLLNSQYSKSDTIGSDRWLNAFAAYKMFPRSNNLIIDVGTCLTFTFIDKKGVLLGGSISPGIRLRNQSMHDYTHRLPLIDFKNTYSNVLGTNTNESIWSGIYYGILYEIEARIEEYDKKYNSVNPILTGGDAHFFENRIKIEIFADSNLTLKGLNYLLNTI